MPRDLIAGPSAPYRERSTYYRGGGKGGGGAFGRRSLTDVDFESMLPGYADALLGSGLDSGSRAGAGDVAARAADVAKAKLKLQLTGGAVTPYDPEDFAGVRPGQEVAGLPKPRPGYGVKVPKISITKYRKVAQAIARDVRRMATSGTSGRSSTYGSGIRGGGMGSSYGSRGYQGGTYGGAGGRSITEGVGGAFKNR